MSSTDGPRPWSGGSKAGVRLNQRSPTQDHISEISRSSMKSQQTKKKKTSGVRAFLTLKEPSTQAWEDLAEAEKGRAQQKGGVIMGGSSQKLPDYVPKVNSKWDGMPDSGRPKSHDSERAKQGSVLSGSTSQARWSNSAYSHQDFREENAAPSRSTMSDFPPSSHSQVPSTRISSSLGPPTYLQLAPLPELSPLPTTLDVGGGSLSNVTEFEAAAATPDEQIDVTSARDQPAENDSSSSVTDSSSSNVDSSEREGPPHAPLLPANQPGEGDEKLPQSPKKRPINFSRPLPR